MHILFVCNEYPPATYGGIGIFVKTVARSFVQKGWSVTVLGYNTTISEDTVWEDEGVRVYWLRKRNAGMRNKIVQEVYNRYVLTIRLHGLVRKCKPDVVESYDWSGPLLFKWFRVPLVIRMHGAHSAHAYHEGKRRSKFLYVLERWQFSFANALAAVSNHMGVTTLKSFGLQREFKVIYNPVDTAQFSPDKNSKRDPNLLLYVGRIHHRKGIAELLKAFNMVVERNTEIVLKLVGGGTETYVKELQALLSAKAQPRVYFVGKVPHEDLTGLYNSAAVTVFPSRAEAFGITIAESMACGVAPIVTDQASGPEIIEHGKTGWLVDVYNPNAFSKTIMEAFVNEARRIAMGLAARQEAVRKYALDSIVEENMQLYRESKVRQKPVQE